MVIVTAIIKYEYFNKRFLVFRDIMEIQRYMLTVRRVALVYSCLNMLCGLENSLFYMWFNILISNLFGTKI